MSFRARLHIYMSHVQALLIFIRMVGAVVILWLLHVIAEFCNYVLVEQRIKFLFIHVAFDSVCPRITVIRLPRQWCKYKNSRVLVFPPFIIFCSASCVVTTFDHLLRLHDRVCIANPVQILSVSYCNLNLNRTISPYASSSIVRLGGEAVCYHGIQFQFQFRVYIFLPLDLLCTRMTCGFFPTSFKLNSIENNNHIGVSR